VCVVISVTHELPCVFFHSPFFSHDAKKWRTSSFTVKKPTFTPLVIFRKGIRRKATHIYIYIYTFFCVCVVYFCAVYGTAEELCVMDLSL
jgi:hypothetical protein